MTKILLVEDDKSLREIYGVRLLAEGYDIVSAGDGEEALAMAIKDRPNLIISDVMMPKISGFDMLDILRSTTETRDIKVIMMTALSSEDQRARGESLGADRYLVKSQVGIEDVVRTVHEVLGDAPVTSTASFSQPQPAAGMRPAPTTAPAPRPMQQPVAAPQPQPAMDPTPQPQQPIAPVVQPVAPAPQPASAPAPVPPAQPAATLPQPTAPFSTARPANLGDRVIQPITPPAGVQNLGSRMDEELGSINTPPAPQPIAPPVPPAPAPFGAVPSMPPTEPVVQFEETPRQMPPMGPSPQQPGA
jgi:CheY-like chemotaxis protein